MKTHERKCTPGNSRLLNARANSSASIYGAPTNSKGRVVPLPSDIWVPSKCTAPGKTVAVAGVGMLGDGRTQGPSVSSYQRSRDQPCIVTTSRSQPIPNCSLNIFANSAIVIPWRVGIGNCPTNDAKAGSSTFPENFAPVIGLGRSQTTTFFPSLLAARMQFAIV